MGGSFQAKLALPLFPKLLIITKMYIIDLTYQAPLESIDEAMEEHVSYLNKNFGLGHFIASGRKVPRTGGIILAAGPGLEELKEILKEDPFVRLNLASVSITEFNATKYHEALKGVL